MIARHFLSARRTAFLTCAIVALQGCGGATDPVAQFENVTFSSAVFAINGTPIVPRRSGWITLHCAALSEDAGGSG